MKNHRPEYDPKVIGENLKRLRKAKSLSVKDVRDYLKIGSVQAIYKYENGRGYPQVDTMFALMELYEADIKDIVCKHETEHTELHLLKRNNEFQGLLPDVEFINENDLRIRQKKRFIEYISLYKENSKRGVAG